MGLARQVGRQRIQGTARGAPDRGRLVRAKRANPRGPGSGVVFAIHVELEPVVRGGVEAIALAVLGE
jgi:hypothetical protein